MLKVLMVASEAAPFVKTGGLGDVIGSLPKALKRDNVDVRVVLPKYQEMPEELEDQIKWQESIHIPVGWRDQFCGLEYMTHQGIPFYFLDNKYHFNRPGYYGYPDDGERFSFFNRAVLEMLPFINFYPDIIHCHDWQTGMVAPLLKASFRHMPEYQKIKMVFTIHNLKYQGVFPKSVMTDLLNLGEEHFTVGGLEFHGNMSFLKGGINYSDLVTTVSPTYAKEIQTPDFGEKMDELLKSQAHKLTGVINGLDYEEYDPAKDPLLQYAYDVQNTEGKKENKKSLQKDLGLPQKDVPLVAMITRLVPQKGIDLVMHVLHEMLELDMQLVVIGTGEHHYEEQLREVGHRYPEKCSMQLKFDNRLAHQLYAASDLFLMPSQFEPCGLGQLIALRYGSLPIARETGGLKDTVIHYKDPSGEGCGFTFEDYNAHDMLFAIKEALELYHDPQEWNALMEKAMRQDNSWKKSARRYEEIYESLQAAIRR